MSYAQEYESQDVFAIDAAAEERLAFIRRTYMHVFGAILAFLGLEAAFLSVPAISEPLVALIGGNWWLAIISFMIVSWIAGKWAQSNTSQGMQYLGLAVYVFAEALIFVPILWMAQNFGSPNVISTAAYLTLMIFGGITAFVMITKKDFSFLRNVLWLGGIAALGFIAISFFVDTSSITIYFAFAMIVLMCGFILYDTSNVLHHYHTSQHVAAALALFASVATLFFYVLQLLMMSDD